MRRDIENIDKMVERSVEDGCFASKEECATAMRNWLILGGHLNPSHPHGTTELADDSHSIEDDIAGLASISKLEATRLQYEILRERDA